MMRRQQEQGQGLPTRREFLATAGATAATTVIGMAASPLASPAQGNACANPAIAKGMAAMRAAIPLAAADPERPVYHFHPPANWNNDPNGTLFYKGWHHLFYQLNPSAPVGGNQHWGHARSRDLVNWEHLPIALAPSFDKGENAIYSGAAFVAADGRPRIIYTSIGHPQPEQWMAVAEDDDLIRWSKFSGNPVLATAAHGQVVVEEWRDPFLFAADGQTYMVCGGHVAAQRSGGTGQVQLYRATKADLSAWTHLGPVFHAIDRDTFNIECPNLFKLQDKWVLIISPHRACEYYVGTLDIGARRFVPETHGILDAGDAYASNISVDDRGTNTPRGRGWNGVMTLPRILSIGSDGALRQTAPPEFASLRGPITNVADLSVTDGVRVLDGVRGDSVEVEAEFALTGGAACGFELRATPTEAATTVVTLQRGTLSVGRVRAYVGDAERYKMRLFVDRRCLEVYVNDGQVALYVALDAAPATRALAVFARNEGSRPQPARLLSLRAWPMSPATFSLDRFQC
jgi:beta-fructofuranosidase